MVYRSNYEQDGSPGIFSVGEITWRQRLEDVGGGPSQKRRSLPVTQPCCGIVWNVGTNSVVTFSSLPLSTAFSCFYHHFPLCSSRLGLIAFPARQKKKLLWWNWWVPLWRKTKRSSGQLLMLLLPRWTKQDFMKHSVPVGCARFCFSIGPTQQITGGRNVLKLTVSNVLNNNCLAIPDCTNHHNYEVDIFYWMPEPLLDEPLWDLIYIRVYFGMTPADPCHWKLKLAFGSTYCSIWIQLHGTGTSKYPSWWFLF